jgi:NAD(P)-dependent dehydrogenase (short-subunit alcohol dehydrogenase family)
MHAFQDRVAVITGAASGIGHSLASRCVQEGMKVVLADIEEAALQNDPSEKVSPGVIARRAGAGQSAPTEMTPEQIADCVFRAIRENRLYILTHPESKAWVGERMENILAERNPVLPEA